MNVVMLEIFLR